ncbi:GntR family transcriptional regulator [Microlunatus antarcticus]|uniref:DNA-binding GntR family transcriptional regulator n=1 Tax=Microlunatus antarcticus TaxID=53388 RepID=A0A7W5JWK4_9ACTN|nr:GntR family transcriptional regulator [Microlunatus antarcticus]MBB3327535.1 DNA-binding GntR family transcriptional regulator [Microlunatus antarcticus]
MPLGQMRSGERPNLTAHGYVLQRMRQAILDGELPAGSRLIQADLASQFAVSITPVREALRDLAGEGLVVFDPHRGSRVRSFDLAEVREIYELRMALEPLMVQRMIGRVAPDRLDEAERLMRRMTRTKDTAVWSDLNRQFHACFAEDDKASRLATILGGLRDSASTYVGLSLRASPERRAESDREHAEILDCYRRGDTPEAVRLAVQHMRTTLVTIEEADAQGLL